MGGCSREWWVNGSPGSRPPLDSGGGDKKEEGGG